MKEFKLFKREDVSFNDNYLAHIKTDIIGFCGCGLSEEVMYLLRDILQEMSDYWDFRMNEEKVHDSDRWYQHDSKMLEIVGGKEAVLYFFYYWLDVKGYTEHGGSVPGWLSGLGEDLLHDLNLAIKEYTEDE